MHQIEILSKPSVLVVDDEPLSRKVVASRIRQLDATVVEAEDGLRAVDVMLRVAFDLAIIDLEMPNLDGFELIKCIHAHSKLKRTPIIVLTSREDQATRDAVLAAGATSYIVKPLNWAEFGEHIREVLTAGRATNRPAARLAG